MKKKIAILGSTGSIGKNLINIIYKNKNLFDVILLTAHKNHKDLLNQAKLLNVKNLIITDYTSYKNLKKKSLNHEIKIFNDFTELKKIFKKKIDYTMSSISGLDGLDPTYKIIEHTKVLAIANKEAIICGWDILNKRLTRYKTRFIPVDSEHFSIWYALKNKKFSKINKIFITASGGPFLNLPKNKFSKIKPFNAINHPNWKMGNKISVDSSTMMNKVFEIIEAKNIFNIEYKKLSILTHPDSYVHAILMFDSGITKVVLHDTNMSIPIHNTLFHNENIKILTKNLDLNKLNNLRLKNVDIKKFPLVKILKLLPAKSSLYETVIVATNDKLVDLFLNGKINYLDIQKILFRLIKLNEFRRYKNITPKSLSEIYNLNDYVYSKIEKLIYK